MKKFLLWVRINQLQTTNTFVFADNDSLAKIIGEMQFGAGNVLNFTEIVEP